jgi:hypothetical protein
LSLLLPMRPVACRESQIASQLAQKRERDGRMIETFITGTRRSFVASLLRMAALFSSLSPAG